MSTCSSSLLAVVAAGERDVHCYGDCLSAVGYNRAAASHLVAGKQWVE